MPVSKTDYFTQLSAMITGRRCQINFNTASCCADVDNGIINLPDMERIIISPLALPLSLRTLKTLTGIDDIAILTAWLERMLLYHESCHIDQTFSYNGIPPIVFNFFNAFEDIRVEEKLSLKYPSMRNKFGMANRFFLSQHLENPDFKSVIMKNALRLTHLAFMLDLGLISEKALKSYCIGNEDIVKRCVQIMQIVRKTARTISRELMLAYSEEMANYFDPDLNNGRKIRIHPVNRGIKDDENTGYKRKKGEPVKGGGNGESENNGNGESGSEPNGNIPVDGNAPEEGPIPDSPLIDEIKGDIVQMLQDFKEYNIDPHLTLSMNTRCPQTVELNNRAMSERLGQMLRNLLQLRIETDTLASQEGDNIDVDEYIDWEYNNNPDAKMFNEDKKTSPDYHIVFCLDRSGSMGSGFGSETPITLAKKALITLASACDIAHIKTSIVAFDDRADIYKLPDYSTDYSQVGTITTRGSTNIFLGLKLSLAMLDKSHARKEAIIILSDGGDQTYIPSGRFYEEYRGKPDIYFLALGDIPKSWIKGFLDFGGQIISTSKIDTPEEIESALTDVVRSILKR